MKKEYTLSQKKIYSDYQNYTTESLNEMVTSNKYVDSVIEIIKDILNEREGLNVNEVKEQVENDKIPLQQVNATEKLTFGQNSTGIQESKTNETGSLNSTLIAVNIIGAIACVIIVILVVSEVWNYRALMLIVVIGGIMGAANNKKKLTKINESLVNDSKAIDFYKYTLEIWSKGTLSELSKGFKNQATNDLKTFISFYPPNIGSALESLLMKKDLKHDEFLMGYTDECILTNYRLIQKDNNKNIFIEIIPSNITKYEMKGTLALTLSFILNTGEEIVIDNARSFIKKEYIEYVAKLKN